MSVTLEEYEQYCKDNAKYFRAVRGSKPSNRVKTNHKSFELVQRYAAQFGDKRTMVYAVTKDDECRHICNL